MTPEEEVVGKTVKAIDLRFYESVSILFTDNTVYKIDASLDYDNTPDMQSHVTTLDDLSAYNRYKLGAISKRDYDAYEMQERADMKARRVEDMRARYAELGIELEKIDKKENNDEKAI